MKRELLCEAGDQLINGACQKKSFVVVEAPKVYGMSYHFNSWTSEFSYKAIDHEKCPFGGELKDGVYFKRCFTRLNIDSSKLNKNIPYTIDFNESSPGIFYNISGGGSFKFFLNKRNPCPYGGTRKGSKCKLWSFSPPILKSNVNYWVDPNPSWPGVFYAQTNGICPHGGVKMGPNCQIYSAPAGLLDPTKAYFVRRNPAYPGIYYHTNLSEKEDLGEAEFDLSRERFSYE